MAQLAQAYSDIETTGLSRLFHYITVIGIYRCDGQDSTLTQLVGEQVTKENLLTELKNVDIVYTYNGSRFDLPFIRACLGIDLQEKFYHHDLMHDCWRNGLRGGFKVVEQLLGIPRRLKGIDGADAVWLWWRCQNCDDRRALDLLLQYNKEDVMNLKALRKRLDALPITKGGVNFNETIRESSLRAKRTSTETTWIQGAGA